MIRNMVDAFEQLAKYYNKILSVNLNKDSFYPIKIDIEEYNRLYMSITFSQWIEEFAMSPYCNKEECVNFYQFNSLENLKRLTTPACLRYKKLIDGEYHEVVEEVIPGDKEGQIYLFVKDLTSMGYEEVS